MNKWQGPGIPDQAFLRVDGIPMTKQEIRAISLSKMRLFPGAVIYDIGAGSGSVAIECKLLVPEAEVYAVEREARAVQLIHRNSERFGVDIHVIEGLAPACLVSLPPADRIFLGGSGGYIAEILSSCDRLLQENGRIVINAVTLHTLEEARRFFTAKNYCCEIIQVQIAVHQFKGDAEFWQARNPITIISAEKQGVRR